MVPISDFITFLFVANLEKSHSFYSGLLGLELIVDQGSCRIYCVAGSGYLGVCERPDQVSPQGIIITLVVDDVVALHQGLVAAEVVVDGEPEHSEQYKILHSFYRDPDGYLIEIQSFDDPGWATPNQPSTDGERSR